MKTEMDLLDEIETDHMFNGEEMPAKTDIQFAYMRKRIDELQLQNEAILLMVKACGTGSEALYQAASEHIIELSKMIANENPVVDEEFYNQVTIDFIAKTKKLGLSLWNDRQV